VSVDVASGVSLEVSAIVLFHVHPGKKRSITKQTAVAKKQTKQKTKNKTTKTKTKQN
jgi:hypothetical protein